MYSATIDTTLGLSFLRSAQRLYTHWASRRDLVALADAVLDCCCAQFCRRPIDLIYDRPSRLYYDAMNMGLKCQDGLAMLIEQARLSQDIWWGKSASFDELAHAVKHTGHLSGPNR